MTEGQLSEMRAALFEEIDRMTEDDLVVLKEFLATNPDRLQVVLRNAPWDDEPETEEERLPVAEAEEWLEQNGGKRILHEQAMRALGVERSRFRFGNRVGS